MTRLFSLILAVFFIQTFAFAERLVGEACQTDSDCNSGYCIPEQRGEKSTGFKGGYCTLFDCFARDVCGQGGRCFWVNRSLDMCLITCTFASDCREGYTCVREGVCLPGVR